MRVAGLPLRCVGVGQDSLCVVRYGSNVTLRVWEEVLVASVWEGKGG